MALSIWVPIGYIGALILSLSLFSSIYRRRSAKNLAKESLDPWHPEGHPERDVYQSLVSASASGTNIPDHVLKAALLNRAMTDVKRIVQMREDKQALAVLLQKGSIGDETTARFALAEKELEAEILDVVSEANTFREGWGSMIFPTASEMATHFKHKEVYYGIPDQRKKQGGYSLGSEELPSELTELILTSFPRPRAIAEITRQRAAQANHRITTPLHTARHANLRQWTTTTATAAAELFSEYPAASAWPDTTAWCYPSATAAQLRPGKVCSITASNATGFVAADCNATTSSAATATTGCVISGRVIVVRTEARAQGERHDVFSYLHCNLIIIHVDLGV